jgi:hypothetical protein
MGRINVKRVILGGLVAGIVFVVAEMVIEGIAGFLGFSERDMALEASGSLTLSGARYHIVNVVYLFVFFIFAMFVYAAVRPRLGAGPKTAFITAMGFWFLLLMLGVNFLNMNVFPVNLVVASLVFNLLEIPPAMLSGAAMYKEPA